MNFDSRLNNAWWALRISFSLVPIVAGVDKYFDLLTNWTAYLNPLAPRVLHVSPETFMHVVGLVEIAAGIIVLTRFTRFGGYLVMIWLLAIAASLLVQGRFLDVAVRDVVMSIGAFSLAKLTEARESALVSGVKHLQTSTSTAA